MAFWDSQEVHEFKKESVVDKREKIDGAGKNALQLHLVFAIKSSSTVLFLLES